MANTDTTALERVTSQYAQIEASARAMVEGRYKARKYGVDFVPVLEDRLNQYREDCERRGEALTSGGFILASGVPQRTFDEMARGDYDHVIEEYRIIHGIPLEADTYTDEDGVVQMLVPFSLVIEKCARLPLMSQLEKNCYSNRGNPAGSIFGLKARYQWSDETQPQHLVQNLVIADGDQARKALDMLMKP